MRIFAVSDIHIDYQENKEWMFQLSKTDFQQDVLLLGGDISDDLSLITACFQHLSRCFYKVFYVPGNHDIWDAKKRFNHSIAKFEFLLQLAQEHGVCTQREVVRATKSQAHTREQETIERIASLHHLEAVPESTGIVSALEEFGHDKGDTYTAFENGESGGVESFAGRKSEDSISDDAIEIVPLYSWYDFSFGEPAPTLRRNWMDFHRCHWPEEIKSEDDICDYFLSLNEENLYVSFHRVISFSHFLPRIDIMPSRIPQKHRIVYPVLGSVKLDEQLRKLGTDLHVYGHSHVQVDTSRDGIRYLNAALGYPSEYWLDKRMTLVAELGT
ncbi:3',5'-cyclic adenosine monophosphate phosphodiesterase CpdA [Thalassocella blandensis]|nr:3',5'-cyclic adenosine monophosphate phosphodiesterase CpdA [Thalassocella blandensis]